MKDPVGIFGKEKVPSPKIEFREVPLTPSSAANTHAAAAQLWCRHEVPASSQSSHTGVLSLYWQHLQLGLASENITGGHNQGETNNKQTNNQTII